MSLLLALENGEIGLLNLQTQRLQRTGISIDEKVFRRGKERHECSLLTPEQVAEESDAIAADRGKGDNYFWVGNYASTGLITPDSAYIGTKHGEIYQFIPQTGEVITTSRLDSFTDEEKMWDKYNNKGGFEKRKKDLDDWAKRAAEHPDNKDLQEIVQHHQDDEKKRTGRNFELSEAYFNMWWKISSILGVNNQVWDFSLAGVFNTDTHELLRDTVVRSPHVVNGQVVGAMRKYGLRSFLASNEDRYMDLHEPSDLDLRTWDGNLILERAAPYNGSGGEQGLITIADGLIFRHHDYHTLDAHEIGSGKFKGKIGLQDPMNAQVLQDGRDLYLAASDHMTGLHYMTLRGGEIKLEPVEGLTGFHLKGFNTSDGLLLAQCGYHDKTTKLHRVEDGKLQGTIELPYKAKVLDVKE